MMTHFNCGHVKVCSSFLMPNINFFFFISIPEGGSLHVHHRVFLGDPKFNGTSSLRSLQPQAEYCLCFKISYHGHRDRTDLMLIPVYTTPHCCNHQVRRQYKFTFLVFIRRGRDLPEGPVVKTLLF